MIQRLTNELAAARSEIEQFRATTVQPQNQLNHVRPTTNQPTSTLTANVQSSLDFPELITEEQSITIEDSITVGGKMVPMFSSRNFNAL
ncbi:hypothetical protein G6F37_012678 [Rhizopus arrhizus]|nr:hypothetical protein G6F38_012727 [Rhizopus arrhizus]KAG1142229.1 hypothetical protein G6F37_012678 [Rhizopus arrhizus]